MKKEYANQLLAMSQDGYEKIAGDFSRTRGKFWDELLFIRDLIPEGARVLDVGCGNGRFFGALLDPYIRRRTFDMFDIGIDYTGIDFSKGLINIAEERYANDTRATFVVGDALALPFPDNSFDAVVSFAVIHHIPSKEYRMQFFRELTRVTKPSGLIVVTAWNVWHSKPIAVLSFIFKKLIGLTHLDFGDAFLDFGKEKNARYVHAFSKREFISLARKTGLTIEKCDVIRRPSGEENFFALFRA